MKKLLTILLIFAFITSSSAEIIEPLSNFHTMIEIPDTITAGSTYQSEYTFSSTHDTSILINFTITHPSINSNEWFTHFSLNNATITPNETQPGHFTSNTTPISKGDHNLIITFQSLPNIVPDDYDFKIELLSENVYIKPKKSSGGFFVYPPTPTPTPTSTPSILPTEEPTITITPPQTTFLPEKSQFNWKLLIIPLILLILYLIYQNRNHKVFITLKQKLSNLRR